MNFFAFALLALFSLNASATDESLLKPYFGYFRTKAYNGIENTYSRKFFLPTIDASPSVKLRQENDEPFRVLTFSFEVPVQEEDGMALRFIFPEMPLNSAELLPLKNGVKITYVGTVQERQGDKWVSCRAHYLVELQEITPELLSVDYKKAAEAPCSPEAHSILGERVRL